MLQSLAVADPPGVWAGLGFAVEHDLCLIGEVAITLGVAGRGITGWKLDDAGRLQELPVVGAAPASGARQPAHPERPAHSNGVVALDHVVVTTPDWGRTIASFEQAGVPLRRTRQAGREAERLTQGFFRLGPTIIEVVGDPGKNSAGPARFWGLAFTVADLDATAALLGDSLRPARPAVQEGRRIAAVDRSAGSSVPLAFMSPDPERPR